MPLLECQLERLVGLDRESADHPARLQPRPLDAGHDAVDEVGIDVVAAQRRDVPVDVRALLREPVVHVARDAGSFLERRGFDLNCAA